MNKAFTYFAKSAACFLLTSCFWTSVTPSFGGETIIPINRVKQEAEEGDADVMLYLAQCYENGTGGVDKDEKKAFKWYLKSAKNGQWVAMHSVKRCYRTATGVDYDHDEIDFWQDKLLRALRENAEDVLQQCSDASDLMITDAMTILGMILEAVDEKEAARIIFEKAAELGNTDAMRCLALFFFEGKDGEIDTKRGVEWLKQAAQNGDLESMHELAIYYNKGKYVEQSETQAFYWYKKAAEKEFPEAMYDVGVCYYYGESVSVDYDAAKRWWQRAADKGFTMAQEALDKLP